jgi:hypothetical protein
MKCMCWICWEDAKLQYEVGEWQVIDCSACGRYFISRQFKQENLGKTLDVEATRQLIVDAICAGVIPAVSEGTARFTVPRKHPK